MATGMVGVAALAGALSASAAPPARRAPGVAIPRAGEPAPALTPARYRAVLAPVEDCAGFFARSASLPDARALLRTLFADGVPQKGADEADDRFVERVVQRLFARLGDPSRIHTGLPVGRAARYAADTGRLTIVLPHPLEVVLESWGDAEVRVAGSATPVRTTSQFRAGFDFAADALPRPLSVPMTADQAARFQAGGGELHILAVLEDYGSDAANAPATRDRPVALQTNYRMVRLMPKCAILTNGGVPVGGWAYDGWSKAEPAG